MVYKIPKDQITPNHQPAATERILPGQPHDAEGLDLTAPAEAGVVRIDTPGAPTEIIPTDHAPQAPHAAEVGEASPAAVHAAHVAIEHQEAA